MYHRGAEVSKAFTIAAGMGLTEDSDEEAACFWMTHLEATSLSAAGNPCIVKMAKLSQRTAESQWISCRINH